MLKRALALVLLIMSSHSVDANAGKCPSVEKTLTGYEPYHVADNLSYLSSSSKLVFFKARQAEGSAPGTSISAIVETEAGERIRLEFDWPDAAVPEIERVLALDLNDNGSNELAVIIKDEGYLREYATIGYVLDVLVFKDRKALGSNCVVSEFPFVRDYLGGVRSARIGGKLVCDTGVCDVGALAQELTRFGNLSPRKALEEAHRFALASYRKRLVSRAARIADVVFLFPQDLLSADTVGLFNDMGFFQEQAGKYSQAVAILQPIVDNYPERTVALLNLADAYFGLGEIEPASTLYRAYVEKMEQSGRTARIPRRASERMASP